MKSDLEELIEAYEIEKVELEKQISEYVGEGDYIYAHYHNKALRRINRRLDVLKGLHNPFYRDIMEEERRTSNLRNLMAKTGHIDHGGFIEKEIDKSESKIQELQRSTFSPLYDSQEIDDALFDLEKGVIEGFKLYFKSPDIFARFSLGDHIIEIKILYDASPDKYYLDIFEDGRQFKSLGFKLIEGQWVYHYFFDRFKDALEIKIILARLIYDVFNYDSRYDSAKIVYD